VFVTRITLTDPSPLHVRAPRASAAAIRASVERGDPFAYVRNRPMAGRITPGESERATSAPLDPAGADEAVADDAHRPDSQLGVVAADTDRDDPASVEHARKSRLSRWQRLPT